MLCMYFIIYNNNNKIFACLINIKGESVSRLNNLI